MAKSAKPARTFDARPDRIDFRDRSYQPPLRSLPEQWPPPDFIRHFLPRYVEAGYIQNQGKEGACTGFGLAAVINYTYFERSMRDQTRQPPLVSPHMLYRNARVYDEWEGEDYEGSSCRGAMKGWFKHGVCSRDLWPKTKERPLAGWDADAGGRPLGAYYRVDARSVADMQAAIFETGAVYCSAEVHKGWDNLRRSVDVSGIDLPVIDLAAANEGGHAFAVMGYTSAGFIIQNSWGTRWGRDGFALLTYPDWVKNGYDAWVAALGAPMQKGSPTAGRRGNLMAIAAASAITGAGDIEVPPWTEEQAYQHAVVMGNDGKLLQRLVNATNAEDALQIVAGENVAASPHKRLAIYVHGGLNSEEGAVNRIRRLGPWFDANEIHPLFIVWRTGIMEAIGQIGMDEVKALEDFVKSIRAKGVGDLVEWVIETAREKFDRAFEVAAEKFIGKAVWSQMKQNAERAGAEEAGLGKLVQHLAAAGKEVHLLGHSAGAIMIGHLLDTARALKPGLKFGTCGLYAPACTLEFGIEKFGRALAPGGTLSAGALHIDYLTDQAETADSVGPYGKSLLYLVSRALEEAHKTPLLGLELSFIEGGTGSHMTLHDGLHAQQHKAWMRIEEKHAGRLSRERHKGKVKVGPGKETDIAHGTFDNDLTCVNASLARMLGRDAPLVKVKDLSGF